jgi:CRISPR-associated protein Csy1
MTDPRLATLQRRLAGGDARGAKAFADDLIAGGALAPSDRFGVLVLRSRAHEALRELPPAIADLDSALALDPSQARIWNELGILCADAGDNERAIGAFERATLADAGYARAWNNLGNALRTAGRVAAAVSAAEHAVSADPAYALAWSNLGALKRDVGDDEGAEAALRRALELQPRLRSAVLTLAGLLRDRSALAEAALLFARAAELDPREPGAQLQLAGTLAERDDLAASRAAYDQALARDPHMLRALFGRSLTLPMVVESADGLTHARAQFEAGLARLEREAPRAASGLSAERLLDELRWSNFLLAYQGGDDKPLQEHYARIVRNLLQGGAAQWLRPLTPRVRAGTRVRVGFVSTVFRDGTAGRYFERWITDLPREDFEVFTYHLLPGADALAQRIASRSDHFRHCPWWRPSQLAPQIRADALDVLVYPELGMGAVPFALAALRLAPLQCAAWGHPVTSGHATVDVFFSSASMEPPDGATNYTEKLVTLPGIGTRYRMPDAPADGTRDRFGLPPDVPLLLCPQSLFKIHPGNDTLFARVLSAIPGALLVGFEGRDPELTARFRARLTRAGIAAGRVVLLPQCGHDDYLRINSACDLMLDTLHWSGGNTSLDAIACGLPVVTLPGRFMRGRQSAGMLRLMKIDELVARDEDDYVRIATTLIDDADFRRALAARILSARASIFDDPAPTAALADFLRG